MILNSVRQLAYALEVSPDRLREFADNADNLYRPYIDRKGKKPRHIDRPLLPLRAIQRKIYRVLLRSHPYLRFAIGGVVQRSLSDAVTPHQNRPLVIRVDVRDFYPSISDEAVYRVWRRMGHGSKVSSILTRLTTYNHRVPQGGNTSMALANLFMEPVDALVHDS